MSTTNRLLTTVGGNGSASYLHSAETAAAQQRHDRSRTCPSRCTSGSGWPPTRTSNPGERMTMIDLWRENIGAIILLSRSGYKLKYVTEDLSHSNLALGLKILSP